MRGGGGGGEVEGAEGCMFCVYVGTDVHRYSITYSAPLYSKIPGAIVPVDSQTRRKDILCLNPIKSILLAAYD